MEKTCFVIMPISDAQPYEPGHFKRVYEYIVKPACIKAGFQPLRADDILNTNYIALDIIKQIINSDMAVCDLSSRNPNVFYELGIRQSFNLPVTLIRDSSTSRVFDVQGFRDIEYDESLRIDNVESSINILAETISNTYASKGEEINSLVSLLGVRSAKIGQGLEISKDTELILSSISNLGNRIDEIEKSFTGSIIPPVTLADLPGIWKEISSSEAGEIKVGDIVDHPKFGKGNVIMLEGSLTNRIVTVRFTSAGEKKIMLNFIKVKKLFKGDEK